MRGGELTSIVSDRGSVAFVSDTGLVPGDTNDRTDLYRTAGRTHRISVSSTGKQANGDSYGVQISADGRVAAFDSEASNLVPGHTRISDVFVRVRH